MSHIVSRNKSIETIQQIVDAAPEMQIKLRQGFGRAIRTETDACMTAILDERAAPGSRYYSDVIAALLDMEQTRCFRTIK